MAILMVLRAAVVTEPRSLQPAIDAVPAERVCVTPRHDLQRHTSGVPNYLALQLGLVWHCTQPQQLKGWLDPICDQINWAAPSTSLHKKN